MLPPSASPYSILPVYPGHSLSSSAPVPDAEARIIQQAYKSGDIARWIVDVEANGSIRFRTVNPAFTRLKGLTHAYMAGRRLSTLSPRLPLEHVEAMQATYRACLSTNHAISYEECLSVNGASQWWLTTLTPILEAGRVVRIVGASVNIDQQKQVQQALGAAHEDLKLFLHSLSHDFQSPLRAITELGKILQRKHGSGMSADAERLLSMMVTAADQAKLLFTDLMAFTHASERALENQQVDLNQVVARLLDTLAFDIETAGAAVHVADLPIVTADRAMMALLLQNLMTNALKYRRDVPPVIEVRAVEQTDAWRIEVKDNGMGMDKAGCARAFDAFQRLHAEHAIEGTGLGLAICARIVERYGGAMDVESVPGVGSTFAFTLPRKVTPAAA